MAECGSETSQAATRIHGSDHPSLKDLNTYVTPHIPAEEWENLAFELLDGETVLLSDIKADTSETNQRRKRMFEKWLKRRDSTWNRLIAALESTDFTYLADQLKKMMTSTSADNQTPGKGLKDSGATCVTSTVDRASSEFASLIVQIEQELLKKERKNLEIIKDLCPHLTSDRKAFLFTDAQLTAIYNCSSIRMMFGCHLRHCWKFDDYSFLETIVRRSVGLKFSDSLLKKYKKKFCYKLKLNEVYEHCLQQQRAPPEGFNVMVTIINDKNFDEITVEEYHKLKEFVSQNCGTELCPLNQASRFSSLLLEWIFPLNAVKYMIETATKNAEVFILAGFVFLKVSSVVILDKRDNRRECNEMISYASSGDVANVERLIIRRYVDVNATTDDWSKSTALHEAAKGGYSAVVETLIKSGADINAVDDKRRTALHVAAERGCSAVVETLIKSGADINAVDDNATFKEMFKAISDKIKIPVEQLRDVGANHCINQDTVTKETKLICPVPDSKKNWKQAEIVSSSGLTEGKTQEILKSIASNLMFSLYSCKECPKCNMLTERINEDRLRTECLMCSQTKKYEFCWCCMKEWKNVNSNKVCGNEDCDPSNTNLLRQLETCNVKEMSGIKEVPAMRVCPKCGMAISHERGCKHMMCTICKSEFCFACLSIKADGKWPESCGGCRTQCNVAHRQKKLPEIKSS